MTIPRSIREEGWDLSAWRPIGLTLFCLYLQLCFLDLGIGPPEHTFGGWRPSYARFSERSTWVQTLLNTDDLVVHNTLRLQATEYRCAARPRDHTKTGKCMVWTFYVRWQRQKGSSCGCLLAVTGVNSALVSCCRRRKGAINARTYLKM